MNQVVNNIRLLEDKHMIAVNNKAKGNSMRMTDHNSDSNL